MLVGVETLVPLLQASCPLLQASFPLVQAFPQGEASPGWRVRGPDSVIFVKNWEKGTVQGEKWTVLLLRLVTCRSEFRDDFRENVEFRKIFEFFGRFSGVFGLSHHIRRSGKRPNQ